MRAEKIGCAPFTASLSVPIDGRRLDVIGKDLPETCVVKVINFPREILRSDASILSIYSEISLMERLSQESGFCQIYDFGVRSDSAYIVMQDCRCSLRDWVERFPVSSSWAIRLILKIFVRIAKSVHRLHQKVIVHFDLKCSNILLKGGPSNEGFWFPNNENPEFDILLADFGVARCYEGQDHLGTVRNRCATASFLVFRNLSCFLQGEQSTQKRLRCYCLRTCRRRVFVTTIVVGRKGWVRRAMCGLWDVCSLSC